MRFERSLKSNSWLLLEHTPGFRTLPENEQLLLRFTMEPVHRDQSDSSIAHFSELGAELFRIRNANPEEGAAGLTHFLDTHGGRQPGHYLPAIMQFHDYHFNGLESGYMSLPRTPVT